MDVSVDLWEESPQKNKKKDDTETPWIEKYRPSVLDEICSQEETVSVLKQTISRPGVNLPHMLFYGPPGTGKTSTALALCNQLFGHDLLPSRVLELNASDERGIDVIRERVKGFSQLHVGRTNRSDGVPVPPFKIIILDEADTLTTDAQNALRRIMETCSKNTRFCIICNYISRISAPLNSRCAKFRFKPLSSTNVESFIRKVISSENLKFPDECIERTTELSEGDMRKAVMLLQSASWMSKEKQVTVEMLNELAGVVPESYIDELSNATLTQDFNLIQTKLKDTMHEGYSGFHILQQLNKKIISDVHFDTQKKLMFAEKFAHCDRVLTEGASEYIQILNALILS